MSGEGIPKTSGVAWQSAWRHERRLRGYVGRVETPRDSISEVWPKIIVSEHEVHTMELVQDGGK